MFECTEAFSIPLNRRKRFPNDIIQANSVVLPFFDMKGEWVWITLYSFSILFVNVPPKPDAKAGFWARWRARIKRGIVWELAILMLILSAAVLILSFQLLRAWFMA